MIGTCDWNVANGAAFKSLPSIVKQTRAMRPDTTCHTDCSEANNTSMRMLHTWIFIGYKFLSRADFGLISDHFLEIYPFQNKNDHFKKKHATSCFHFWVMMNLPGNFRPFPGISAFFPGISAQKNRHIFTQSRVRSAQKARNPKLTTIIKKWPFPAPSQEIRPKGRNLGNGHLFVSFRRSRYVHWHRPIWVERRQMKLLKAVKASNLSPGARKRGAMQTVG